MGSQSHTAMQQSSEQPKKAPRKHVTTACVPCRESKIRVCCTIHDELHRPRLLTHLAASAMGIRPIVRTARRKEGSASTSMGTIKGSMLMSFARS